MFLGEVGVVGVCLKPDVGLVLGSPRMAAVEIVFAGGHIWRAVAVQVRCARYVYDIAA